VRGLIFHHFALNGQGKFFMSKSKNKEHRQYPRIDFVTEVVIQEMVESEGNTFVIQETTVLGKALDISEGGMRMEISDAADLTQILKLNFRMQKNDMVEVYGNRVWQKGDIYGLEFIPATSTEDKKVHFFVAK
jgi:hypothetical protein